MISMLKVEQMLLKYFYDSRFKHLHDGLSIIVILAPGCGFFSTKCVQFPLTFSK